MKRIFATVVTLFVGIALGITSTTYSAPVKQYVQATFDRIIFVVNGEEKSLNSDPLVYQGRTYLPVRTVLNALGYNVDYKEDTKTVLADKSVSTLNKELDIAIELEGSPLEDTEDITEQLDILNEYLIKQKEKLENYEQAIKSINAREDLSQEDKDFGIELRKPLIEATKKAITDTEEKIKELHSNRLN